MKKSKLLLLLTALSLGIASQAHAGSATWSGGTGSAVWDTSANWGGTAFPGGPSGTADVATFSSAANITAGNLGLGTSISLGGIILNTGGNVTVTDNSNTLTLNNATAINVGASQSLTLNTNTTLAAATSLTVNSGSTLTFGSGTLTLGNFAQTFTGAGTVDLNSTIAGGGTTTQLKLTNGVTVNFDGSFTGASSTYSSTPISILSGSTMNLITNPNKKIQLGLAGTNEKATLMILTSGLTNSGVLAVSGAGTGGLSSNVFTVGANLASGGTAGYSGSFTINNTSNSNAATVIMTANSGTTLNFSGPITSAAGTTGTILQVTGGGTIIFSASTSPNSYTTSTAANGTEVMNNTNLQLDVTFSTPTALTGNTTVDAGSSVQLLASNQMPSGTLTINGAGGSTGGGTVAATGALENFSGANTFGAAVALGSSSTISSDASTLGLTGGINTGTSTVSPNTVTFTGAGNIAVSTTGISGTGNLAKSGAGSLALSTANTYTGTTTLTGGKTYVTNTTGSAFGANTVGVSGSSTVLGGNGIISGAVTLSSGATLYSGAVATGTPTTGAGTGMTLSSALNVNGAALTFALSNTATSTYASPATSTTYLNLGTTGTMTFSGTDTINLVDLSNGNLSLRMNQPYLLAMASAGTAYSGLVIENSLGQIGLSQNGYQGLVLGVSTGSGLSYTAFNFDEFGSNGVSTLADGTTADPGYFSPSLYLAGGDLEVVPEPGTWALMLGGLALLVVIQRRRSRS